MAKDINLLRAVTSGLSRYLVEWLWEGVLNDKVVYYRLWIVLNMAPTDS